VSVGRESPFREDLRTKAEEAVARERLVDARQAGKDLAFAVVIYKLRILTVTF
jgi:hypothetical protein